MRNTVLALLLAALAAPAQTQPDPHGPMRDAGPANLPGLRAGPNDLIAVSVYGAPELTRTVRVSPEGDIRLPMLEQRLRVQGLLPSQMEDLIARALTEGGILVKPLVMVTIAEFASRPVSVAGAVRRPLTFQAAGRVTLLDALARAEGLSPEAGPEILLTRSEGGRALTRRIPVRALIDEADPALNIQLSGGEEIRVPEARKIFVTGNVKKPGAFPVREGSPLTVLKALALAEGLSPFPQKYAYVYRKDDSAGGVREIQVELRRIMKRTAADFPLEPEDTLYIPEDGGRKTMAGITEKIVGFGAATASGVLIWRR
jgi:polysaccharide export outer membrane protein